MLLDEIADFLVTSGVVASDAMFTSNLPGGTPNDVLAVYEYGGMAPEYVMDNPLMSVERPRFQVVSRSKQHSVARTNIERAYRALGQVVNQTIGGTWYRRIKPIQSGPIELYPDGDGRTILAWNFEAEKGLSPL